MTKIDIVNEIWDSMESDLMKKEIAQSVEVLLDIMKKTLISQENVKISRFGEFKIYDRKERWGRNPKTKVPAKIEACKSLKFKPSAILKDMVNEE